MSNAEKLKKKAADFEQRKQYDRALELYAQVLDTAEGTAEEKDVPLYNRVGDLHLRLGNVERAVTYYEKAVDLYAEGEYLNNAIALCNKILRHAPGRSSIYYKLGKISAKKGFNSDAKQNFLEYADRMQKSGKMDEAFRALQEFADLCPGQDDIRLLLAEQLTRAGRKEEALEQLQILHEALDAEGRSGEAAATFARMQAIDPAITPRRAMAPRSRESGGLVFLDLDEAPRASTSSTSAPASPAAPVDGLEPTAIADDDAEAASERAAGTPEVAGLEPTALDETAGLPENDSTEAHRTDDDFVNLADWLAQDEGPRSTRMIGKDDQRAVRGQADFDEMLAKFKQGVAANVDDGDAESHYDLGVAYREMGLLDEAISEFQTALRGSAHRIRTYESLGQCFLDKSETDVAIAVLATALAAPGASDDQLVGVLYLLGAASEQMKRWSEASAYYQRVVAVDIDFRDVADRIVAVGRATV